VRAVTARRPANRSRRSSCAALAALAALGCGEVEAPAVAVTDEAPGAQAPLQALPLSGWEEDAEGAAADAAEFGPFAACAAGPRVEDALVEFDTGLCTAFSWRAPLAAPVDEGDLVELDVSHTILASETPGEGRMVLRLEGDEVWRWSRPIPAPATATRVQLRAHRALPVGAWLGVHVSNHGANQWRLVGLRIQRAR
jgi:hypothetical protein